MSGWANTITLGGVLLDVLDNDTCHVVENVTGWDDAPAAISGLQTKAQQDGDWDGTGSSGPRVVDIAGLIREATPDAARATQRALAALRPQSLQELVVVNDTAGAMSCWARVTNSFSIAEWIDDTSFTYTIEVTAPDPLKYGPPTYGSAGLSTATPGAGLTYPLAYPLSYGIAPGVTPGAVSVPNTGTTVYWPRLRIDGPVTNPVVTEVESGAWVRYNGSLTAGQWLDLDMAARRVLLQGQVSVRHLVSSSGDWLSVPPGGGTISWTADTADPAALLSVWGFQGSWI